MTNALGGPVLPHWGFYAVPVATCPSCGQENPEGFRLCGMCGSPLAVEPERSGDVRKVVTVVFCDVAGYTAAGERLDPEALRRLQSRYFADVRAALERHGGKVEKFIGDAAMAVFGIPQVHEDDALRAVRAAADVREAVAALGLEGRIGVNTGEVVAGAGDALVTGDAVNVAARLEQSAEPGEILIGEDTFRLVRDAVDAEPVEPLRLKGKQEVVAAYRLSSVGADQAGVARRLRSPLVGRRRELELLRNAFERMAGERACHLFTVLGPAGVGKSRLVAEFLDGVDATVLRGRCLPYGEGITFWPLHEVLEKVGDDERARPALDLLGGTAAAPEELFLAVRRLLEALARERPLAVVFDDLQWAEPTFLDLVEHVADWSRDAPILLVCLARPELLDARRGWGGDKFNATSVLLEPLGAEESGHLLANLLGSAHLPAEASARITEAAEGNPLFVEELLAMLIDEGRLERRNAGVRRDVVGVAEHLLALLRDDEVDQELGGVGMRRVLVHGDHRQRGGCRLHPDPVDRRALLGADHRVVVEDL